MPPKTNEKAKKRNKCSNCGSFKHLSKNCPDLDLTTSGEDSEDDDVEETNIVRQYKQQLQQKKASAAAGKQQKRRAPPSPKNSEDVDVPEETNVVHRPLELKRKKTSATKKPQHKKRKTENEPITAEADTNFPWIDSVPIQSTSSRSTATTIPFSSSSRSAAITATLPIHAPSSSSSGVDVPDDFEDGATGVLPDADADADDVAEDLVFGVVRAKIVGINYYDGMVSRGESVVIRREPHNPYDRNALRVDNMAAQQVGHIPRDVASKLSPFIDRNELRIEGTVTGARTSYNIALKLSLLAATPILGQSLTTLLNRRGLRIESGAPSGAIVESVAAEARAQNEWAQLLGRGQQMDQRKSQEVLGRIGMSELDLAKLPQAPQPAMVGTAMLSYQLQGLRFLVQQEHPLDPTKEAPVQFWTMRKDGQGEYYYNLVTNFATRKKPNLVRGGILADDMGLGKTLQTISLIAGDPTGQGVVDNPTPSDKSYSDATLIVAPLSVIGNWVDQLAAHVSPARALKTYVFHGPDRNESPTFLAKHDVVVTTYNLLAQYDVSKKKGLFGVKWRRVVLDEGHVIKNRKAKQSEACMTLEAERRWVLTGTPIQNSMNDLFSLVRFLRLAPFDDLEWWNRCLARPLRLGDSEGLSRLKLLMRFVCLRRTKDMRFDGRAILALPTIESFLHRVQFSDEARNRYRLLEDEAKKLYREFRKSKAGGDADAEEQSAVKKYSNLLAALTRLRQCCDHHCLVGSTLKIILEGQAADAIDMERLVEILRNAIEDNEDCCICLETLSNAVITPCRHVFDRVCIQKVLDNNPICPMCRGAIKLTQLIDPPPPPPELEGDADADSFETADKVEAGGFESSPKIDALLEFLKASQAKDRTTKSVVFSQWTSFLDVVGKALRKAGIHHVRLDGKMQRKKRDEAIASFQRDPEITVFLISLKCGSLGLNLTAANQCFLLDPWWNPSIEDQAVDRIYRLGQTRPVKVFRFVIEDTIEDRVMELQEKKRKMAEQALGEKGKANDKTREARLADLQVLLG